jgi:hypothetical protein
MVKNSTILLLFMTAIIVQTNAQKRTDNFLKDMFSINNFNINSTFKEVSKESGEDLRPFYKEDYKNIYHLINHTVNLPGFKFIDRVTIDTLDLTFEDDELHDVDLIVRGHLSDGVFDKTRKLLDEKYGKSIGSQASHSNYKKYTWNLGAKQCSLDPSWNKGFIIRYGSKVSRKRNDWVYKDRKGKGNGTLQPNLSYFEKLLNSDLTLSALEKNLPQWETTGLENHILYQFDFKKRVDNSPHFSIIYKLNDYDLKVETIDTTANIISELGIRKTKDINIVAAFKKDLEKQNYAIRYSSGDAIFYKKEYISVFLSKDNSIIDISNFKNLLP